jgi:hypothetical protein
MASSDIAIVNLALGHLRQRTIASFADRSPEAARASEYYPQAIDTALRAFDWTWARSYAPGVLIEDAAIPGFAYGFEYPADCLMLRGIANPNALDPPIPYKLARFGGDQVVFANVLAPTFVYTARVTDVPDYDPHFVQLASYHLAAMLAMPLTGKRQLLDDMRKMAEAARDGAWTDAANEEPNTIGEDPTPDWLQARGVPNRTRQERSALAWGSDCAPTTGGTILPNSQSAVAPIMVTLPGPQILPAYIPGLTAPVPEIIGEVIEGVSIYLDGGRLQNRNRRPGSFDTSVLCDGGRLNGDGTRQPEAPVYNYVVADMGRL